MSLLSLCQNRFSTCVAFSMLIVIHVLYMCLVNHCHTCSSIFKNVLSPRTKIMMDHDLILLLLVRHIFA